MILTLIKNLTFLTKKRVHPLNVSKNHIPKQHIHFLGKLSHPTGHVGSSSAVYVIIRPQRPAANDERLVKPVQRTCTGKSTRS
jgi:hypothetical protein